MPVAPLELHVAIGNPGAGFLSNSDLASMTDVVALGNGGAGTRAMST